MTKEEKDRMWQALPDGMKDWVRKSFENTRIVQNRDYDKGWEDATSAYLMRFFGKHNLESALKFEIGDRVIVTEDNCLTKKGSKGFIVRIQEEPSLCYWVAFEDGPADYSTIDPKYLAPYDDESNKYSCHIGESHESLLNTIKEIKSFKDYVLNTIFDDIDKLAVSTPMVKGNESDKAEAKHDDVWLQYRMELAKDLAVASIRSKGRFDSDDVVSAVDNMVKRLRNNG